MHLANAPESVCGVTNSLQLPRQHHQHCNEPHLPLHPPPSSAAPAPLSLSARCTSARAAPSAWRCRAATCCSGVSRRCCGSQGGSLPCQEAAALLHSSSLRWAQLSSAARAGEEGSRREAAGSGSSSTQTSSRCSSCLGGRGGRPRRRRGTAMPAALLAAVPLGAGSLAAGTAARVGQSSVAAPEFTAGWLGGPGCACERVPAGLSHGRLHGWLGSSCGSAAS